jgi:Family of unknown function (DUF6399)
LFHVQHELSNAVCAPLAAKERAAAKALTEAPEQLEQVQARLQSAGEQPAKRGPGRPSKAPRSREQAPQALETASRAHERLTQPREQIRQSIEAIGQAYHFVDLERGGRRTGHLIASASRTQLETLRTVAQTANLRQRCLARIDTAERGVPKMQATIEFVSGSVRHHVHQLDVPHPVSYAMHAQLIPSLYLERLAQRRTVSHGKPLRELAMHLRTPLFEPGGAWRQLRPETQNNLRQQAKEFAEVVQRSSSHGAGRNGSLSRRNHQLRGLDLPRKRTCLTAIHNFFLTRPDGTTAAERLFAQKPRSRLAAILDSVDLPPAPRSPQRRF